MAARNPVDTTKVYIAAGLISGCGALFFNVMPAFVGAMAESFKFSESQLGDVVAAFNIGFTATAVIAMMWIHRIDWRISSGFGVLGAVVVFVAMSLVRTFIPIAILVGALGIMLGLLYALILAILGDSDQPDRAFGIKLGIETLPGALMLFLLPVVIVPVYGFSGVALTLAATALILGSFTFLLPRHSARVKRQSGESLDGAADSGPRWMPVTALGSSLLFFTGIAATWAFLERLAADRGISPEAVGFALSIGFIICGLGGFCAALIADRWGRLVPMVGIALVNWIGLSVLATFNVAGAYAFGTAAFLFTVNFALAYTFGLTAEVDNRGRFVVLSAAALSIGGIIGPGIGGRLVEFAGFGMLLLFSSLCMLSSVLSYWAVSVRLTKE